MNTKALRQKILDLAIRGKLVPQDPNDEPASVLLERVRAEKQQMVRGGKLKAKDIKNDTIIFVGEDNLHYEKFQDGTVKCIEDEIPFEVPEGWEWCRLNDLFSVCSAKRVLQSDWKTEGVPFYRAREIVKLAENNYVENELFIAEEHYQDMIQNYGIPQENDLMVSAVGTIGKVYIVKKEDRFYYKDASVICFQNINKIIDSKYAKIMFESSFLQQQMIRNSKGTTVDTITISIAMTYLCVLPPLKEQINIALSVEKILALVDDMSARKEELHCLIGNAKTKILDLAIRGQLVKQEPNDEPASILLESIRAEKEKLIKQGKIKRDKQESIIFRGDDNSYYETINGNTVCIDDELPFELPEGWEWTRLQNVSSILTDGTHKTPQYCDRGYIFLSSKNVTTGKIDWENIMYIPESLHTELYNRLAPIKGDILLAKNGTTGVAAIVDRDVIFDIYVSLALIRIAGRLIDSQYILNVIGCSYVQEYFNKSLKGIGVPNLHLEHIRRTLIPISPYAEQQRITRITERAWQNFDEILGALS
ncbi:MAG: restriction endonuclease subunit S [Lachnospiraceae bacterium]|nr:restriction endonuclease subunit S [Lachnospiraceae bacterium]